MKIVVVSLLTINMHQRYIKQEVLFLNMDLLILYLKWWRKSRKSIHCKAWKNVSFLPASVGSIIEVKLSEKNLLFNVWIYFVSVTLHIDYCLLLFSCISPLFVEECLAPAVSALSNKPHTQLISDILLTYIYITNYPTSPRQTGEQK